MITKHTVAEKIQSYMNHNITLAALVDWCENVVNDGDIAEEDVDVVTEVAARIGLADVKNFGLLWEDCEKSIEQLGFVIKVDLEKAA